MVADLRVVLKERHVSQGATNELLRLLAPMKRDVVEAVPARRPVSTVHSSSPGRGWAACSALRADRRSPACVTVDVTTTLGRPSPPRMR